VSSDSLMAERAASHSPHLSLTPPSDYLHGSLVIAELELRKLRHDPSELLTRAIQPALWLLIFGQAFSAIRAIPTDGVSYLAF
jgi:ABC-2 type transport system permease protein